MLTYKTGNLLEAKETLIAHQVNCQGVMGSGVALAIKEKWPKVFSQYALFHKEFTLGDVQMVTTSEKIICNIFSQRYFMPREVRHTNYEALALAFEYLRENTKADIAMPRIGCGLGGGDWRVVSALIESIFDDRNVVVYDLEKAKWR